MTAMRWIVGVDLGARSRGALHFSRWLAEATGARWEDAFVPVHVLHDEHLRTVLRYHHLDEAVAAERAALERTMAEVLPGVRAAIDVVQGTTIEDGLDAACARHRADGVIVSRAARRDSRRVLRLGSVARRLLRRLASPVIVVPPDLTASSVGTGPIVALSSLAPDSAPACRLARTIAEDARRDLALVHVVPGGAGEPASRRDAAPSLGDGPELALARWAAEHEVWPDLTAVVAGEAAEAALAFAEARRASLVVSGARPAAGVRDMVERKLWRRLAAHARCPVLVAPAEAPSVPSSLGEGRPEHDGPRPEGPAP